MTEKKTFKDYVSRGLYLGIRGCVKLLYPKCGLQYTENIPEKACVFVGNHSQINGPVMAELYFPGQPYIWCASQMMNIKEVPGYAYVDFWRHKNKIVKPFYRLLSCLIAPLSSCIFNNAHTIAVYHDARLLTT